VQQINTSSAPPAAGQDFLSLTGCNPYPFYDRLRTQASLFWDDSANGWLVTSYEACRYVELREDLFRHPYADPIPNLREIKGGETISVLQGPRHPLMHRFLLSMFTPRQVKDYCEHYIRPIVRDLLARFSASGTAELSSAFGDLVPPRVILALLGMPWQDDALVHRVVELHNVINQWISGLNLPGIDEQALAASRELNDMLLPFIRARRETLGMDLISRVWSAWPESLGEPGDDDVMAVGRELFLAGAEATTHAISNAFYLLLSDADLMARVRANRQQMVPQVVEESLRLFGAVHYRYRVANQDCEIDGIPVAADQKLVLINAAANRDPARYESPERVDVNRGMLRDHLAFNVGPRTCIGAGLARAEIVEAINGLLNVAQNLRLDGDAPEPVFVGHFARSFRPLHVTFDPIS
jgi:cytochrome P450